LYKSSALICHSFLSSCCCLFERDKSVKNWIALLKLGSKENLLVFNINPWQYYNPLISVTFFPFFGVLFKSWLAFWSSSINAISFVSHKNPTGGQQHLRVMVFFGVVTNRQIHFACDFPCVSYYVISLTFMLHRPTPKLLITFSNIPSQLSC